ncbi:hypothetical protein Prum_050790 [Phytohabitans rumicis]|uniref:Uncharacterized protein n=1 Tax=Phytohabitans rumicis TaxID=1076125 RepID=A0A6V8LBJ7_9ACTN|nr:hypothetical protein Prum_050790 [Phytohabitans rumicis]
MATGVRWAETTRTSYATPNSSSASAAAFIVGQSESLPMITPTTALICPPVRSLALPQPARGSRRPGPYVVHVVAEHRDVPDLPARADLLAVQVDLGARVGGEQVVQPLVERDAAGRATEDVRHHDGRSGQRRLAHGVVQDRPQVLLELRRPGALDGPVPGVVRTHGELVHQHATVHFEEFDGEQPDDAQRRRDVDGELLGRHRQVFGEAGCRGEHLDADPVLLHGLHHRVRRDLPERRARHQHGQLPAQRHPLLQDQLDVRQRVVGAEHPHPPAVVPAADRLRDHRPADLVAERADLLRCGHRPPVRDRRAQRGQPFPHGPFVLGVQQRVGARVDGHAVGGQRADEVGRHVLVVERDDVAALGEGAQGGQVGVVAEVQVGHHQRGAVVGRRGEHAQGLAKGDRGLMGHPGQLPSAHHADNGQTGSGIHLARQPIRAAPGPVYKGWPACGGPS